MVARSLPRTAYCATHNVVDDDDDLEVIECRRFSLPQQINARKRKAKYNNPNGNTGRLILLAFPVLKHLPISTRVGLAISSPSPVVGKMFPRTDQPTAERHTVGERETMNESRMASADAD